MSPVTIRAYKYPAKLHYELNAELIELTDQYAMVRSEAGRTFKHYTKQKEFIIPYVSIEWFFFNRGYTVAATIKENEEVMYYCNIAEPAQYIDGVVSFVDVDLDYIKEVGEQWKLVDKDEFEQNSKLFSYPAALMEAALSSLERLKLDIAQDQYPFNISVVG